MLFSDEPLTTTTGYPVSHAGPSVKLMHKENCRKPCPRALALIRVTRILAYIACPKLTVNALVSIVNTALYILYVF